MLGIGKCPICKTVGVLLIIGAINWGLVGLFGVNLVSTVLGESLLTRVVYILVGVAGVIGLISCFKSCPCCAPKEAK